VLLQFSGNACGLNGSAQRLREVYSRESQNLKFSADMRVPRAAYAALGSQMPKQLFFQHSACLDE
jgi:hypothetical protein